VNEEIMIPTYRARASRIQAGQAVSWLHARVLACLYLAVHRRSGRNPLAQSNRRFVARIKDRTQGGCMLYLPYSLN
jgi:hypothetical protein